MKHEYLLLGEVVRPQGIRGEVKLRHYTDGPERFLDLETVYREEKGGYVPIRVTGARVNKDDVYLTLEGVDDRNAAERMRARWPRTRCTSPIFWARRPMIPREPRSAR